MPTPADEFVAMVRTVVKEELHAHFERLLEEFRAVLREASREADDAEGDDDARV